MSFGALPQTPLDLRGPTSNGREGRGREGQNPLIKTRLWACWWLFNEAIFVRANFRGPTKRAE